MTECKTWEFGMDCATKSMSWYAMDHMRFTWYVYILVPIYAVIMFVVIFWQQIPGKVASARLWFSRLKAQLRDIEWSDQYRTVTRFWKWIFLFMLIPDMLGQLAWSQMWLWLFCKAAVNAIAWACFAGYFKLMQRLNSVVLPITSLYLTVLNAFLELAYSFANVFVSILIVDKQRAFSAYSYAYLALVIETYFVATMASIFPRLILLGFAITYGDLDVTLWSERMETFKAVTGPQCTKVGIVIGG